MSGMARRRRPIHNSQLVLKLVFFELCVATVQFLPMSAVENHSVEG